MRHLGPATPKGDLTMEPRPPVTLTYRDLVHRDEPVPQRDRVREMFGDTVTLTRSVLLRAADAGLDVH